MLPKQDSIVKGIFCVPPPLRNFLIFTRQCCVIFHMKSRPENLDRHGGGAAQSGPRDQGRIPPLRAKARLNGGNSAQAGDILYIGYDPCYALLRRRRLAGIRRCAKAFGLEVVTLSPEEATPEAVRAVIDGGRTAGCVVECWMAHYDLPPCLFGSVPAVFFNPPERGAWRGAASVACDEAAVARAAFEELAAGLPHSYAVVVGEPMRLNQWARERVAAFRTCCREEGKPCRVFPERMGEDVASRGERLSRWAAALPEHCAVFAVNDTAAATFASALSASAGRSPPRSVTLIGVDAAEVPEDGIPASPISSVKLDFELSGYLAAKMVAGGSRFRATADARKRVHPLFGPLFVERRQSTRGRGRREPWVLEAVDAIRREACDGLTAASLAKRFPVSRKLFELRFREAIGHSVLNEILHVRMERVFDLLARRDFPIGAIADFCGFDSARELRSLFRKRTGTSMREWRRARR